MAASVQELEEHLTEAGNKLLNPPSSVEELLSLLDKVHDCLSKVEQSPPKSMQNALSLSQKALIADSLLKHPDEDVKVAVAASISEITRITAPDAPYDDEQMKAVFQLIVSSFENLVDMSSRSYAKRTSILETVAKVRSCVVMLDLECDSLIIEMFQHFLKAIRDSHPENVITSMETIMTLVLEESEDISPELLSLILDFAKDDNEDVLPISRKLAERVLQSCATKLKPYLIEAVKSLGLSLDNYSNVVASICRGTSVTVEQNDVDSNEKDSEGNIARESAPQEKEKPTEMATPERVDVPNDGSVKSIVSNGVAQTWDNDSMVDSNSTMRQKDVGLTDEPQNIDKLGEADPGKMSAEKEADTGHEEKQTIKKGKKSNSAKQTESSKSLSVEEEMESKTFSDSKDSGKNLPSSPRDDLSANAAATSENEKVSGDQVPPLKQVEDESTNVASPSRSESLPDESHSKKAVHQKKKDSPIKEAKIYTNDASKMASEGPSDSEAKPTKKSGRTVASGSSSKKNPTVGATKKGSSFARKSKAKLLKQSEKIDEDSDGVEESLTQEDKKRQGNVKANSNKDALESSSKDDDKEMVSSPKSAIKSSKDDQHMEETPKVNSKRKRSLGKEKASDIKEYGENLMGSRIKVWWPIDRTFYEGIVDSFDAAKKRHLVLYDDGDQEILNLKRQKWEFIQDDSESTEEEAADQTNPDAKSEKPQKKKAKAAGHDQSAKSKKTDVSANRGGGASSSKSEAASTKSGKKSKEGEKTKTKSKGASKAANQMETDSNDEETDDDDKNPKTGKSKNDELTTPKSGGTSKASTKSKEETPKPSESSKASSTTKGRTRKAIAKSNQNGSGKSKPAASSGAKERDEEHSAEDAPKALETSKGKSTGSAKSKGSKAMSGKKRKW